jgi:hypothetical protein
MPRSYVPVELNTFVAGLVTEASPLTFPPNASLDEENFILNKNGSRARRLGLDFEDEFVLINSGVTAPSTREPFINTFKWENVGGDPTKIFSVVQIENVLQFFDAAASPLSANPVAKYVYPSTVKARMGFASVDGLLVVVTGGKDVDTFSYNTNSISKLSKRLKIRDFFGVTDVAV